MSVGQQLVSAARAEKNCPCLVMRKLDYGAFGNEWEAFIFSLFYYSSRLA